jgi:hypothetical protein
VFSKFSPTIARLLKLTWTPGPEVSQTEMGRLNSNGLLHSQPKLLHHSHNLKNGPKLVQPLNLVYARRLKPDQHLQQLATAAAGV